MSKRVGQLLNLPDALVLSGVAMLGTGLWWISPAVALIVVGGLFMAAGALLGRHK